MVIVGHEGSVTVKYGESLKHSMDRVINTWTLQLKSEVSHILLASQDQDSWLNKTSLLIKQPFRGAWSGNLSFNMFIDEDEHPFQMAQEWNGIQSAHTAVWQATLILRSDEGEPTSYLETYGELVSLDMTNNIRSAPTALVTLALTSIDFRL